MKHYYDFNTPVQNAAVAFGRFDGMHMGHRAVLKRLASFNESVLISFADNYGEIIYTETEKEFVLQTAGVENMISLKASVYEDMNLDEFVRDYLVKIMSTRTVVAGENYDRLSELKGICSDNGICVEVVATVTDKNEDVTADRIRETFRKGDMNEAIRLLGGSYYMAGYIVHGKGVGRQHDMPTANLHMGANKIWPVHGVYGTEVHLGDSKWKGLTNVGLRPSDDSNPVPSCETFIPDLSGDIYDTFTVLEAYKYIRPVMEFGNLDEVRAQIDKDMEQII